MEAKNVLNLNFILDEISFIKTKNGQIEAIFDTTQRQQITVK